MRRKRTRILDFEVDKLTNCIENSISGEVFDTIITEITWQDRKLIKKEDWLFNWHMELKTSERRVFKVTTIENPKIIQGLLSLTDKGDHIFMNLIENATFNRGKDKLYRGVAGNLIAFACKMAFEKGYDGFVSFISKTNLVQHYQDTLGAKVLSGLRMLIETRESLVLVRTYFKS
ncbi:MAG: hypothetical protein QM669_12410 [Siphonobacter sp.]